MASTDTTHLLLLARPSWGHLKPLCILATRIVSESSSTVVTILTSPNVYEKAYSEVSRQFKDGISNQNLNRIRVACTFVSNETGLYNLMKLIHEAYPVAYRTLLQAQPITCVLTGTTFDAVPPPAAVVVDFFAYGDMQATRAVSGNNVPILASITGGTSYIIRLCGPESMGGFGDFGAKVVAEAARTGKSVDEVAKQMYWGTNGMEISLPGVPVMHDYEFFPQQLPFEIRSETTLREGYKSLMECDGVIVSSTEAYEKVALEVLKSWLSELGKPVYAVGPLISHNDQLVGATTSEGDRRVAAFLDAMLTKHGERSVLFISFGTAFWPTKPEYIEEVLGALLEKNFPFIFAHASPFAKLPEDLVEKISSSGLGMLTSWAPQYFILNHPATGWFLTHCGHGSVMESLGSGIPLICWPFYADQPSAAAHITERLKAGFELIEVRTALGLKPLHRNGRVPEGTREAVGVEIRQVIDACRGQKGKEVRQNAEKLKAEFVKAWEREGSSKEALQALLRKLK